WWDRMPMVASCTAWFFPSLLRLYRSALQGVSDARHPAYDEIIKGRNRIGLGPQADLAGAIAGIPMLQEEHAVERRLEVLPYRHHLDRMPRPECRRRHTRRGQLVSSAVVVIQPKIVLQGVGPHHRVVPLGAAKDDATRGIFPAGHRLELHKDIDVRV